MDGDTRIAWYRSPIDKAVLARLTERSDAKGFFHLIAKLVLAVLTGAGAWLTWHLALPAPLVVAAVYAHCTVYAFLVGLAGPVHELCHGTVFKTRFWNEFFLRITSFLSWSSYVWFRASHAKHHQVTVHHDLDLEIILPQKMSLWAWLSVFTIQLQGLWYVLSAKARHTVGIVRGEWETRISRRPTGSSVDGCSAGPGLRSWATWRSRRSSC